MKIETEPFPTWKETKVKLVDLALVKFNGNKTQAAKALGISLRTLRYFVHRHNMQRWKNPNLTPLKLKGNQGRILPVKIEGNNGH